jgi:hypothetical protein
MGKKLSLSAAIIAIVCLNLIPDQLKGDAASDDLIVGFRQVEVASVADAIEQLYGKKMYMSHDMRPLATAKFAGPATTVRLTKGEHTEGSKPSTKHRPAPFTLCHSRTDSTTPVWAD